MGIQINGNTNNINAGIGSLSIEDINELDIVGVATAANFKTGVSNLHNVGLTLSGGQIDVGSNIKLGNAGVITATTFSGNLSGGTVSGTTGTFSGAVQTVGFTNTIASGNVIALLDSSNASQNHRVRINSQGASSSTSLAISNSNANNQTSLVHGNDGVFSIRGGQTAGSEPTSGTERLRIDTSGRLGVGVNSFHDSSTRLQLQSPGSDHTGIVITAAATSTLSYIYFGDTADKDIGRLVYENSSDSMQFWTNNAERLRITANGHLLLGTSTDYADNNSDDFQIYGTGHTGMSITSGSSNYGSIYFGDGTSGDARNEGIVRYNHSNNSMELWTNRSEKLRITTAGNVGINDTDPSYALNVIGDNTASNGIGMLKGIIGVQNDTTAYGSYPTAGISFQTKYRTGPDVPLDVAAIYGGKENTTNGDKDGYMGFAVREEPGSGTQERMRISSGGNVGINESAPDTKLHISHSNATEDVIKLEATPVTAATGERSRIIFNVTQSNGQAAKLGHIASHTLNGWGGELAFHTKPANSTPNNATNEVMRLHANGYVTKPYQPVFSATTSGTSSAGFIVFNQTSCNVGGHYSTSNGRFTAPVAGNYYFSFYGMSPHNNTSNQRCAIYVNGNYWSAGQYIGGVGYSGYTNGGYTHLTLSTALPLAVNDYVQLSWQYANLHDGHCKFTGFLVG